MVLTTGQMFEKTIKYFKVFEMTTMLIVWKEIV